MTLPNQLAAFLRVREEKLGLWKSSHPKSHSHHAGSLSIPVSFQHSICDYLASILRGLAELPRKSMGPILRQGRTFEESLH
jgi:hypothetical protein